ALLIEVKDRVADVLYASRGSATTVAVAPLLRKLGLKRSELVELEGLGLIGTITIRGSLHVPEDDVWVLELWGSLREAGFTKALGFGVEDLRPYVEAITALFDREVR